MNHALTKVFWLNRLRVTRDAFYFHCSRPDWDLQLSEHLPFGEIGNSVFANYLLSANSYLEYGSGSSTLTAAVSELPFVTIESDPHFLAAVQRRVGLLNPGPDLTNVRFIHGDIGPTGPWGKPIFPSIARPQAWRRYPLAPWLQLGHDYRADLVLVDGRFRVACVLAVILNQTDADWTVLVDDYVGRNHYEPIAEFALLTGVHGRMAEFKPKPGLSRVEVQKAFDFFASDWR